MLADHYRGAIYTGVSADLVPRTAQHRTGSGSKFTSKYGIRRLVYAERHDRIEDAIAREKAIKKWLRHWKIELIKKENPDWLDLFESING